MPGCRDLPVPFASRVKNDRPDVAARCPARVLLGRVPSLQGGRGRSAGCSSDSASRVRGGIRFGRGVHGSTRLIKSKLQREGGATSSRRRGRGRVFPRPSSVTFRPLLSWILGFGVCACGMVALGFIRALGAFVPPSERPLQHGIPRTLPRRLSSRC
ncbi:uncharacterized protein [Melopsittacus undulatus]|uniref:uncharacterized protein n=1 Tax=Melopsittacus undulatus TaxID=13146 RepID=UPI001243685C|nr:uncharacterized protein LOC115946694 [Melopsittacus undulatus]